ncbi:hypothetical protein AMK27_22260 [Streptomyces sp. CB02009]|uniref:hypothetical protein n=1 Tax=Streptomyces sp. CB02009 TaxID=1703938 RepID=UPI00093C515D|nr:hypothetical protein [Streptomyces sp. CB02009]OKJ60158.1 hypothetical protein AMK27_22260 [Streptomyces sp. CB02009]
MAPSSPTPPTPLAPRLLKAVIVSLLAVAASHLILSDTLYMFFAGQAASTLGAGPGYSSDQVFTAAIMNTVLLMPLVLWIGMRVTGERKVWPMVLAGTAAWITAVGHGIDTIDDVPWALLPWRSLILVVTVTALASAIRRRPGG